MWFNIFVVKILDNNVIYKFSSQLRGFRIKTKKIVKRQRRKDRELLLICHLLLAQWPKFPNFVHKLCCLFERELGVVVLQIDGGRTKGLGASLNMPPFACTVAKISKKFP